MIFFLVPFDPSDIRFLLKQKYIVDRDKNKFFWIIVAWEFFPVPPTQNTWNLDKNSPLKHTNGNKHYDRPAMSSPFILKVDIRVSTFIITKKIVVEVKMTHKQIFLFELRTISLTWKVCGLVCWHLFLGISYQPIVGRLYIHHLVYLLEAENIEVYSNKLSLQTVEHTHIPNIKMVIYGIIKDMHWLVVHILDKITCKKTKIYGINKILIRQKPLHKRTAFHIEYNLWRMQTSKLPVFPILFDCSSGIW